MSNEMHDILFDRYSTQAKGMFSIDQDKGGKP